MRKILLVSLSALFSVSTMAQVTFETSTLKEACAKAKLENKLVFVACHLAGAAPCEKVNADIFPLETVSRAINSRFVSKIYDIQVELNTGDKDQIKSKYKINAFPTYLFLDSDGNEVARMLGHAGGSPQAFIDMVMERSAKENWYAAREQRFKTEPAYSIEHLVYMSELGKENRLNEKLDSIFSKRTVAECLTSKDLSLYPKLIVSFDSPIVKYMINNREAVSAVMGAQEYEKYMKEITTKIIFNRGYFSISDELNGHLAFVEANPFLESGMATLVKNCKESFISGDAITIAQEATKLCGKFTPLEKNMMGWFLSRFLSSTKADKELVVAYLTEALKDVNDKEVADKLNQMLEQCQ